MDSKYKWNLQEIFETQEKLEEAINELYKLIEEIKSYKGTLSRGVDELYNCYNHLEKALELDPHFVNALYAMGAALKKVENYTKALEYLEKAIELEPDFIHAKALKKLIENKYI